MSVEHPPSRAPLAPVAASGSIVRTRRSLLDRPQFLGICPTFWFWNDWRHQRLLMPLVLLTALPVAVLIQSLAIAFPAASLPLLLGPALYAFLLQGLVERHIRAQLRARAHRLFANLAPRPSWSRRRAALALAGVGLGTALAASGLTALTTLALLAVGLGIGVIVAAIPPTPPIATRLAVGRPSPPAIAHSPRD